MLSPIPYTGIPIGSISPYAAFPVAPIAPVSPYAALSVAPVLTSQMPAGDIQAAAIDAQVNFFLSVVYIKNGNLNYSYAYYVKSA